MGCASTVVPIVTTKAQMGYKTAIHNELISLPAPKEQLVSAVYKFRDQTGQYKSSAQGMTWSTAVTQGATSMLLKSLEDSGWFVTLEREGLSNLLNERRIIRQTREQYSGSGGERLPPLPPLLYAGLMLEGGVISYETNTMTGGFGAKYFGLGGSTQFRRDEVTVYLRAISTQNGRILKTVYTTKSILSRMVDVSLYRYVRVKRLLEIESGYSTNEPVNMCVQEAIEKAVYSLIIEGVLDQLWELQNPEDIESPIIQSYVDEKEKAEETVQFDEEGRLVRKGAFTRSVFRRNKWGVGLNAAAQYYVGDYQNSRIKPMGEIRVSYRLLPWFTLAVDWGLGQLADKEKFQTLMTHVDLTTTFTPFPRKRIRPFGYFGFCSFKFWAEDSEGYDIKRRESTWGGWEPAFIWGAGAEYSITSSWGIHFSVDNYFTLTDELDGVVHGKRDDAFWRGKLGFAYYFDF
jgi:curli production assembly/transport component CsgG